MRTAQVVAGPEDDLGTGRLGDTDHGLRVSAQPQVRGINNGPTSCRQEAT